MKNKTCGRPNDTEIFNEQIRDPANLKDFRMSWVRNWIENF